MKDTWNILYYFLLSHFSFGIFISGFGVNGKTNFHVEYIDDTSVVRLHLFTQLLRTVLHISESLNIVYNNVRNFPRFSKVIISQIIEKCVRGM